MAKILIGLLVMGIHIWIGGLSVGNMIYNYKLGRMNAFGRWLMALGVIVAFTICWFIRIFM